MNIDFGLAQMYSEALSDNVKRGLATKVDKNEFPGTAPIGYLNINEDGLISKKKYLLTKQGMLEKLDRVLKRIEIDPIDSPVVSRMFTEFATGFMSLKAISKFAYNNGAKGKSGKQITKEGIKRILTNQFYIGNFIYKDEIHKGNHKPLVTKETFDKVRDILGNRPKPSCNSFDFFFKGLVKCGKCGYAVVGETKTKKSGRQCTYCRCSKRGGPCDQPGLRIEELAKQFSSVIKKASLNKDQWELALELAKLKYSEFFQTQSNRRMKLEQERNNIERKINSLIDMRSNNELTEVEFLTRKNRLQELKSDLEEQIKEHSQSVDDLFKKAEKGYETAYTAQNVFESGSIEDKKRLIGSIGWNFTLKDKILEFQYKIPFDYIAIHNPLNQTVGTQDNPLFANKKESIDPNLLFVRVRRDSNPRPPP